MNFTEEINIDQEIQKYSDRLSIFSHVKRFVYEKEYSFIFYTLLKYILNQLQFECNNGGISYFKEYQFPLMNGFVELSLRFDKSNFWVLRLKMYKDYVLKFTFYFKTLENTNRITLTNISNIELYTPSNASISEAFYYETEKENICTKLYELIKIILDELQR